MFLGHGRRCCDIHAICLDNQPVSGHSSELSHGLGGAGWKAQLTALVQASAEFQLKVLQNAG